MQALRPDPLAFLLAEVHAGFEQFGLDPLHLAAPAGREHGVHLVMFQDGEQLPFCDLRPLLDEELAGPSPGSSRADVRLVSGLER